LKTQSMFKTAVILLLALSLAVPINRVGASDSEAQAIKDAREEAQKAFEALLETYNAGGNVSELEATLNEALSLISQAEMEVGKNPEEAERLASEAGRLAQEVLGEAPNVRDEGLMRRQTATIVTVASIAGLVVAGGLVYFFGPDILWRLWVWLRRNYRVKVKGSARKTETSCFTMEHACAAVLALMLIIAAVGAYQFFVGGRISEAFSELGVLGPGMKLADYPKETVAGEAVRLYAYIGNHMGKPMYYTVMIKIGDNETAVNPAPVEPVVKLERVMLHDENSTSPVDITLTKPGLNQRIIFELWMYNETTRQVQYHERWCQIWVNVTAPP